MFKWPISMVFCLVLMFIIVESVLGIMELEVGFYNKTCPNAESIVSSLVKEGSESDSTMPAALLRLHYHDCIVQSKGPSYQVLTGRRDGRVSNVSDAANMPDLPDSIELIKTKFAEKGLSEKDLVLLSAAHTIGTTACFFLERRLYEFPSANRSDPLINPKFLPELQSKCPFGGDILVRVPLDHGSENKFDTKIFKNIRNGYGVIDTDAKLYTDPSMKMIIDSYLGLNTAENETESESKPNFESDFVESIVKMGKIGVKMGKDGEIRRVCSKFN